MGFWEYMKEISNKTTLANLVTAGVVVYGVYSLRTDKGVMETLVLMSFSYLIGKNQGNGGQ